MIVEIITMGKVPRGVLDYLTHELKKTYSPLIESCVIGASLGIPPAAYNPSRNQYNADLIIERIRHRITGENRVLGVLNVDLYTQSHNLNFIFGQAEFPGRLALVSLCRLNPTFYGDTPNRKLFLQRAIKETTHELGHTFGLEHCFDPSCVMSFSNSILEVDKKLSAFCENCKKRLRQITLTI